MNRLGTVLFMQFQLAGLASGFDWQSMIEQLMAAERIPQQRMRDEQSENTEVKDALELLNTKLDALKSTVENFSDSALYNSKQTSYSDETLGITASASTDASQGNYEITVTQLATTSKRSGTTDVGGTIGDASTLISNLKLATDITEGTFSINGQEITVAETDSLQDVLDAISVATSGEVTGAYDSISDTVTLTSGTGQLELGGSSDTSNFLSALKLDQIEVATSGSDAVVTSTGTLGIVDLSSSIADSGLGITGTGTIIINGVAVTYDADNESMATLMSNVNDSAANVTMTYDVAADQFRIVNNETGALEMPVVDSENNLMATLGLDGSATVGQDLQFTVDGGLTLSSRSNVIDSDDHGITGLTITATETGTQTISISQDSSALSEQMNSFISSYNDVQDYILEQTKITVEDTEVTAGDLAGNREIYDLDTKLRSLAFSEVTGVSNSDLLRLEHMGIDFISGTSKLEIKDSEALESALASNLSDLEEFFMGDLDNDGDSDETFAARMVEYIDNYTVDGGILDTQIETLTEQNNDIDEQIEEMERRLEFTRAALEASFIAMEEAQSQIQQQSSALANLQL